ncbi:hypothetical protein [Archangium sp.]|uniref:hypothetical protein n=1 Tax=Archangium sp. TaxID=1872627 RepID=UPI00389A6755
MERIQKSYGASYAGPAAVSLAPEVAPVALAVPPVARALHDWYAAEIRKDNTALAKRLRKLKPGAYNGFLTQHKTRALECAARLPAELQPKIDTFLSASEAEAQDAAVRELQKATEGQPREVLDCMDAALVKLDSRGVLVGGLVWGKTPEGSEKLKPTRYSPGRVFILRPQVLTAWPGRADSALRVLDPRQGPWTVLLAHTYEEKSGTHRQKWKGLETTRAADYLQQTNNGHFLLVDDEGAALGWLDMDQAAFYEEEWAASADISKPVFTSGIAAFVHGVWWDPDGFTEAGGAGGMTTTRYQNPIYVIDFLRLVKLETSQRAVSIREPYPEFLRIRQLRKLYQGKPRYSSALRPEEELGLSAESREDNGFTWHHDEELGRLTAHEGRLHYELKAANARTTLKKLYRIR